MGPYGGLGPMTNAVLWVEVVIFAIFVAARLYTRVVILSSVGVDDYLATLSLVVHIIYTSFVTVGTKYGIGQLFANVGGMANYVMALKYEIFSQVAGLLAIGLGKLSVGVFLLRIVRNKIQIALIWFFIATTSFITLFAAITVVVQCIPVQKTWDRSLPGKCWLDFSQVGYTVGSWFVFDDFGFAILPWFAIWNLNMKRKEKLTIAFGLSLGIFAGVCGIVRTVALAGLNANEYIYGTVPMLIWSATESLVTIMCASIPVLRPLYVRIRYGSQGSSNNKSAYNMPMYGANRNYGGNSKYGMGSTVAAEPKGITHQTTITYTPDNASDESILRDTRAQNVSAGGGGIQKREDISITYEAVDGQPKGRTTQGAKYLR